MSDKDLPAFPCEWDYIGSNRAAANGMTLRDYFAAKVLQSAMANASLPTKQDRDEWLPKIAEVCYEAADAMLQERSK